MRLFFSFYIHQSVKLIVKLWLLKFFWKNQGEFNNVKFSFYIMYNYTKKLF